MTGPLQHPGGIVGLQRDRLPPARGRSGDRAITAAGLACAGVFLVLAVGSLALPVDVRHGYWLPLHLTLAGAAATAVAAVLPFFTAALTAAPPAAPALRIAAVALVAAGGAAVPAGVAGGSTGGAGTLAALGGVLFVSGIGAVAAAAFGPLHRALGSRRGIITLAYAVALADVALGATLATLFVGGYLPVLEAWASLKPVHAWLNLFGFVSLVIGATLVHLYPTVLGTRIVSRWSVRVLVASLSAGAPLIAGGYFVQSDLLARAGAIVELAGAAALVDYCVATWRSRGRWTTDSGWHLVAAGHLSAAVGWFTAGVVVAAARTLWFGASPEGWSIAAILAPIVVGWVGQAILGAATHLVPAVGPGDPLAHRRQRALLGRGAVARLVALETGTALLAAGLPLDSTPLTVLGVALAGGAVLADAGLLATAAAQGRARRQIEQGVG